MFEHKADWYQLLHVTPGRIHGNCIGVVATNRPQSSVSL